MCAERRARAAKARKRDLKKNTKKAFYQGPLPYLILLLVILWMVQLLGAPSGETPLELNYSTLLRWVEADLKNDEGMDVTAEERTMTCLLYTSRCV